MQLRKIRSTHMAMWNHFLADDKNTLYVLNCAVKPESKYKPLVEPLVWWLLLMTMYTCIVLISTA